MARTVDELLKHPLANHHYHISVLCLGHLQLQYRLIGTDVHIRANI